jgi:hypothetical protein
MLKKTTIILVLSFALILCATPMVFGQKFQAEQIPLDQRRGPTPPAIPLEKGFCVIRNDDGSTTSGYDGFQPGEGVAAYMDPATCPDSPPYPFGITDVHFHLYEWGGEVWPVQIRVNVREVAGGDSCNGPGAILCSETFTIPYDSSENSLGRMMNLTMSVFPRCCVNGPFFLEIVYTGGTSPPYPTPLFADPATSPADTCNNWAFFFGTYDEWYDQWGPPIPGNIGLRATGYTDDPACEPWGQHKMHFPQLPDLEGWDVFALSPKTLADDWQCSGTGEVLGIHFWGSWKDLDGDPETDDVSFEMPVFHLGIYSNRPVGHPQNPYPYSIPGDLLWWWQGNIPGTPLEAPGMEHWYHPSYNPNIDTVYCNDHVAYWQYDFFFDQVMPPPEPFVQFRDEIYWLSVSAELWEPPYEWGWKTSRDHFMDDAVYTDDPPYGWVEMYEPPRCNWFDVVFDPSGEPYDLGSTNYYGQGWYYYETFDWWNMWFYDNPFVESPKHFWLDFFIQEAGSNPYAEFAINFTRPEWDEMEMGRPPLPEDGNPDVYIVRFEYPVELGPNYIEASLPWNPEWISIDFRAEQVRINGWFWHECSTSMDMAFVITGEANSPPYEPSNPSPPDGAIDQSINVDLSWSGGDPDPGNTVTYDIFFGDSSPPPLLVPGHHDTTYDPGTLDYDTQYFWRIVARDPQGEHTPGPEWDFTTEGMPGICGDVNHSGAVEAGDVVYLIAYLFRGGPAPSPLLQGDVNCSGAVEAGDVVYLIGYLFRGGPDPCDPDGDGIPDC